MQECRSLTGQAPNGGETQLTSNCHRCRRPRKDVGAERSKTAFLGSAFSLRQALKHRPLGGNVHTNCSERAYDAWNSAIVPLGAVVEGRSGAEWGIDAWHKIFRGLGCMMPKLEHFEKKLDFVRFSGGRGWDGSSEVGLVQIPPSAGVGLLDAARRLSPMRSWCRHCRAGFDDSRRLSTTRGGPRRVDWVLQRPPIKNTCSPRGPRLASPRGPFADGMDITRSSCWSGVFPASTMRVTSPSLRRRQNGALRGSHCA